MRPDRQDVAPGWGPGWPEAIRPPAPVELAIKWVAAAAYGVFLFGNTTNLNTQPVSVMAIEAVGFAALLLRGRRPEAALVITTAVVVACDAVWGTSDTFTLTLPALATFSLVVRRPPPQSLVMSLTAWTVLTVADVVLGGQHWSTVGPHLLFFVAAVASGLFVGSHRALLATAEERAQQSERERGYHAERAVAEERLRIARDLHDVVAHHVSLLVVQAGAVRESLPPEHPTREVLDSMIDGGRQAMSELRTMLEALREPVLDGPGPAGQTAPNEGGAASGAAVLSWSTAFEGAPRAPQPSLAQVRALVEGAGMAGLPVTLEMKGAADALTPAVGLAAYRITQEALTNVVKHAPGAETLVAIDHRQDGVSVRVRNGRGVLPPRRTSGDGPSVNGNPGQGLLGMRERAAQCHGWVQAGPCEGGFAVEAWLPTGRV